MNHKEFIDELSTYGIDANPKYYGVYDSVVFVNGERISNSEYKPFGYFCGGAYNPHGIIDREYTQDDIKAAVRAFASIQKDTIQAGRDGLSYWDIKDYLAQYPTKSKILKDGIDRVVSILKEDFNTMLRFKKTNKDNA